MKAEQELDFTGKYSEKDLAEGLGLQSQEDPRDEIDFFLTPAIT